MTDPRQSSVGNLDLTPRRSFRPVLHYGRDLTAHRPVFLNEGGRGSGGRPGSRREALRRRQYLCTLGSG